MSLYDCEIQLISLPSVCRYSHKRPSAYSPMCVLSSTAQEGEEGSHLGSLSSDYVVLWKSLLVVWYFIARLLVKILDWDQFQAPTVTKRWRSWISKHKLVNESSKFMLILSCTGGCQFVVAVSSPVHLLSLLSGWYIVLGLARDVDKGGWKSRKQEHCSWWGGGWW